MGYNDKEKDLFEKEKSPFSAHSKEARMDQLNKTNAPVLDNFWMPFTANRQFKATPRLLAAAEGMYYTDVDGHQVLDGTAGLWCCNAGHGRKKIAQAVERQLATLDYAPTFQMGHPIAFDFAAKLAANAPGGPEAKLDRVFFTGSGSESVDTALKISHRLPARHRPGHPHADHRARKGLSRRRLRRHFRRRPGQQSPGFPANTGRPYAPYARH